MAQDRRIFTQISERVKIQTIAEYNESFARLSKFGGLTSSHMVREHPASESTRRFSIKVESKEIESNAAVDGTGTGAHLALEVRDTSRIEMNLAFIETGGKNTPNFSSILAFDGTAKRAHLALTQGGSSGEMNVGVKIETNVAFDGTGKGAQIEMNSPSAWDRREGTWLQMKGVTVPGSHSNQLFQGKCRIEANLASMTQGKEHTWLSPKVEVESKRIWPSMAQRHEHTGLSPEVEVESKQI
ncbi:hypothetical protein B0H13DRAFT_1902232 [Mycena leptocephala]|nr:hypothetical protein B0H13DRAFT_1902232 [Mycena leptocephala]